MSEEDNRDYLSARLNDELNSQTDAVPRVDFGGCGTRPPLCTSNLSRILEINDRSTGNNTIKIPILGFQVDDGEIFEVDVEITNISNAITTILEDIGLCNDDDEIKPLPNVGGETFRKVVKWVRHHMDDPPLPQDGPNEENRRDDITTWNNDFLDISTEQLRDLFGLKKETARGIEE